VDKTAKYMQEEVERWGNVIKAADIKLSNRKNTASGTKLTFEAAVTEFRMPYCDAGNSARPF